LFEPREDLEIAGVEGEELEERDVVDVELGAEGRLGVARGAVRGGVRRVAVLGGVEPREGLARRHRDHERVARHGVELVADLAAGDRDRARVEVVAHRHPPVEEDVLVAPHAVVHPRLGGVEAEVAPLHGPTQARVLHHADVEPGDERHQDRGHDEHDDDGEPGFGWTTAERARHGTLLFSAAPMHGRIERPARSASDRSRRGAPRPGLHGSRLRGLPCTVRVSV
jgi:hypothetical protein